MTWFLLVGLLLLVYLALLTGFLHGAAKAQIEAVLALLIVGDVITVFLVGGWRFGLVAIGSVFVSAVVTRPLAARTAAAMLRHETGAKGRFIGLPGGRLDRISRELGREFRPMRSTKKWSPVTVRAAPRLRMHCWTLLRMTRKPR